MSIGKWIVQIPAKKFMAGVHRFATKKDAMEFRDKWLVAERKTTMCVTPPLYREAAPTQSIEV